MHDTPSLSIGHFRLSLENRALIIAEIGQAHDGSLGIAHSYIDSVADAGADAVKFQTHIAEEESTPSEAWRVPFSYEDATRLEYWRRMEFSPEQWLGLQKHANERGLLFLSSPFSLKAFNLLHSMRLPAWKVASGELTHTPLLEAIAATGQPVLLSSGMSSWRDLDDAVQRFRNHDCPLACFQCTTAYPSPPAATGLNVLSIMHKRYGCLVGLSDHSGEIYPGLFAVALGARLIEVHVTFDKALFGPDTKASLTFPQLRQLTEGVAFFHQATSHPVDKDQVAEQMSPTRALFGRSVVAATNLSAGTILETNHLALKKPGTGLPPSAIDSLIGRSLVGDIEKDHLLNHTDLA